MNLRAPSIKIVSNQEGNGLMESVITAENLVISGVSVDTNAESARNLDTLVKLCIHMLRCLP